MKILKTIGLILLLPILLIGGALLNNTFNDDKIETIKTTVVDLDTVKLVTVTDDEKRGFIDPQEPLTNLYNNFDNADVNFINISKDLVIAFNGYKGFTENYCVIDESYIYFFTTKEITFVEAKTSSVCYYASLGNPSLALMVDIENIHTTEFPTDMGEILPEECWSTMIDEDCSQREMRNFMLDELYIYKLSFDEINYELFENEMTDDYDLLRELKIYYR